MILRSQRVSSVYQALALLVEHQHLIFLVSHCINLKLFALYWVLSHSLLCCAGTCYLGIATSSMNGPVVKKVHADGDSREHRVQHKDYFAEQALQMVMEHL